MAASFDNSYHLKRLHMMVTGNSFEDGKLAGQKLLKLFADLGQLHSLKPAPFETVENVIKKVWSWSSSSEPHDVVLGFLSQVLSEKGHASKIIEVCGTDQFLHDQEDCAPVCNIPNESGIFAFAHWTGETDGDAWCYDIKYGCVRCLPVSCGQADADQSRLASYGVSPDFHQLAAYLRCDAERRNWISP